MQFKDLLLAQINSLLPMNQHAAQNLRKGRQEVWQGQKAITKGDKKKGKKRRKESYAMYIYKGTRTQLSPNLIYCTV